MFLPFFLYIYICLFLSFTLHLLLPPFLSLLNLFLFLCSITYLSICFLSFSLLLFLYLFRLGATSLYNCNKFWPISKICRENSVRMETPLWTCLSFLGHMLIKLTCTAPMDSLYLLCYRYCTTVCPRSSDPFHIVTCYIKWVTTSWTHSITWQ